MRELEGAGKERWREKERVIGSSEGRHGEEQTEGAGGREKEKEKMGRDR